MKGRIVREERSTRLNILGKLRIGVKKKTQAGKEYPSAVDYFVATEKGGGVSRYEPEFKAVYGEKPNLLKIVFLSDNFEDVCNERYEYRIEKTGRLFAKGDGLNFEVWSKESKSYVWKSTTDTPDLLNILEQTAKKETILTLRCWLPEIRGVFGVWEYETKGKESSIPQITSVVDSVYEMAGTIRMIPFDLSVQFVTGQNPGDTKRYPVVSLTCNLSQQSLEIVNNALAEGVNIGGMLDEAKVQAFDVKQLAEPEYHPLPDNDVEQIDLLK